MTITVIRGVVRGPEPGSAADVNSKQKPHTNAAANPAAAVATGALSSEASVVCVRCSRSVSAPERIKDTKEARSVAKDVAQRVGSEDEKLEAHNLDQVNSKNHLAE
jgi:hypothetical protein